jgi:hypothetical protein
MLENELLHNSDPKFKFLFTGVLLSFQGGAVKNDVPYCP